MTVLDGRLPRRLSLVTLGVADVERSAAFFEALGWERSPASVAGVVAFFRTADSAVGLHGYADLAADAGLDVPEPRPAYGGVTLAINLESEDAVREALALAEGHGATISQPAQATEWGGFHGYFRDLDGHSWEIAYNPGWGFSADGSIELP